tara:strand:- start:183 stop:965 length:783 start_codon:yes stop_codon:yes gene_type:complete
MKFRKSSQMEELFSEKLSNARKKNILIKPIPRYVCNNLNSVKKIRSLAEKKLKWQPIGFKIGATNKEISKILKAKEPFYSFLFKERSYKNNSKLKLTKNTLGIELEVGYKISKKIFQKKIKNKQQLKKFIFGLTPVIELVGYRQNLKKISFVGQAAIDFGLHISFIKSKLYKVKNILNFSSKTLLTNQNNKRTYYGHTSKVMGNPINSLYWLIKELQRNEISLKKDFWVTTGTTTEIVPVKKGDRFLGEIFSAGKVKVSF